MRKVSHFPYRLTNYIYPIVNGHHLTDETLVNSLHCLTFGEFKRTQLVQLLSKTKLMPTQQPLIMKKADYMMAPLGIECYGVGIPNQRGENRNTSFP